MTVMHPLNLSTASMFFAPVACTEVAPVLDLDDARRHAHERFGVRIQFRGLGLSHGSET